jgi:DNA uptake protein ComE-like DNA-binding protein
MNLPPSITRPTRPHQATHGSILIIVLWITFGLVSLALYFAHSMTLALRAADNQTASVLAQESIASAVTYLSNTLANIPYPGQLPDPLTYETEAVPIGDARFWLIGRDTNTWQLGRSELVFDLTDESAKLNLNVASAEMLEFLPGMTPALAAAIIDWRDTDSELTTNGAEDETYQRLNPPYSCKNAPFDSLDELRLVAGIYPEILYGEDANLNGILDPNENDGDTSPPLDNRDGHLDLGILEYLTVWSRESNSSRTNLNDPQQLATVLEEALGNDRANQVLLGLGGTQGGQGGQGGPGGGPGANTNLTLNFRSLLEFHVRSGLTAEEFMLVETNLTATTNAFTPGLVNVNTASETVLACIPGIGTDLAATLVAARQANASSSGSLAWVKEVLGDAQAVQAGPFLTAQTYQFTADIAAVGQHARGYRRVRFVFDTTESTPRIVFRQDLTHLGWALGTEYRQQLLEETDSPSTTLGSLRPLQR